MKSKGIRNGNDHHRIGTISSGVSVTEREPFDNEHIVFDAEGADSPATETPLKDSRRRSKRIIGALLLLLLIASIAIALYFMLGGNRTRLNVNVRDTRPQAEKTHAARQNPDDVTTQAVAEALSATKGNEPSSSQTPNVITGAPSVPPNAPVTVPVDGLSGTVNTPVTNVPALPGEQKITDSASTTGATGSTVTERTDNTSAATASRRSPERSIRCALPVSSPNQQRPSLSQNQVGHATTTNPTRSDERVVLPSFGAMLPVRSLGILYTLRSGSLARFELTRDVRGQGWAMKKGTVIVGVNRGSEYDRAYIAIVGFIDPESGRFVKFTGDVLGGDGGAGMRGRRRSLTSAWSRAFSRVGASAVNVAGLMLSGLGRSSVVVSDAYGYRVVNPVTSELSGLVSERTNQQQRGFVEVPAGTQGYVMVTDLPQEIRGVDALGELSTKDLAERSDVNGVRVSTGLSERELADLLSSGSVDHIRAALPRMTPEMRRIAEAVIAQSGDDMQPNDPNLSSVDPRQVIEQRGVDALADMLASTGYIIQRRILIDLAHTLRSRKPWLIEGPRGGGKTALAEALAKACNLATFYLQGMDELTLADVLYSWDREAQTQMVRQELAAGIPLKEAQGRQFTREYLILGEALAAFDYASYSETIPILIIDEADKLTEKIEDMLLQLLGRGWAHVPRLGNIGVRDRKLWPVVILLSNDIRHDLSAPLRSRCLYSWLEPPTPREEVRILRARVPEARPDLLLGVTKLINCIRRDMPAVRDKPGLRESIDLLEEMVRDDVQSLRAEIIDEYLCFLGKRQKELMNLRQGIARLEFAVHAADQEIDEWVEWACAQDNHVLEEAA